MPIFSYLIDTPEGKKRVTTDKPISNRAEMEFALGPPAPRPNPVPTPGYGPGTLEQAVHPDYPAIAQTLRMAAPLAGAAVGGGAGSGVATLAAEPFARKLEGRSALPSLDELSTPEGQQELYNVALGATPGGIAGVVERSGTRRLGLPFHGYPWTGIEGEKTIRLRAPHATLPTHLVPEELAASKVRDAQGNLIRAYHGTRGLTDQQALDPAKLGEAWFGEQEGLYTTEQPSITTGYSVRERAKNFEAQLAATRQDTSSRVSPAARLANLKHKTKQLAKSGWTPDYGPHTFESLNRDIRAARTASAIPETVIPGVTRSDVRNPQTRPVYLNITNPFHVEKSMPREQAVSLLHQMLPKDLQSPYAKAYEEIGNDVFDAIHMAGRWEPSNVGEYIDNAWAGSTYDPIAKDMKVILQHPQVRLLLNRGAQLGKHIQAAEEAGKLETYDTLRASVQPLRNQFLAAVKAYMPPMKEDRWSQVDAALTTALRGADTKVRGRISGGEIIETLRRAGIDTRDALSRLGYDGITHIGGGPPAHRVWIAFHPDQIYDAIPVEAHAESLSKNLPPPNRIAPHSVVGGPLWKQSMPPQKPLSWDKWTP